MLMIERQVYLVSVDKISLTLFSSKQKNALRCVQWTVEDFDTSEQSIPRSVLCSMFYLARECISVIPDINSGETNSSC